MSVALSRILRTSSFRLTLLCSGLFVASVLILFGKAARLSISQFPIFLSILTTGICRHALRVSEVVTLKWDQIDLEAGRLQVIRRKGSDDSVQPLSGVEIRALRKLKREQKPGTPSAPPSTAKTQTARRNITFPSAARATDSTVAVLARPPSQPEIQKTTQTRALNPHSPTAPPTQTPPAVSSLEAFTNRRSDMISSTACSRPRSDLA